MPDVPPSTLRLGLDEAALAANWRVLDAMSGTARAGAAVKADCYGLRVVRCLPVLRDAGCRDFFVAHWSEVESVLAYIPASQVSVLHGVFDAAQAAYARAVGVRPVIDSLHQARVWSESGGGRCDLMIDSGINRLGIAPSEIADPLVQSLDIQVLMSHLACADEDSAMNARQLAAFRAVIPHVAHREASLANSAGIALGADYHCDLTRPGLALYGGVPRSEFADTIRQVAYPEAALLQVRDVAEGATVGYNAAFTAPAPMRVGVVSLGYADGIMRSWAGAHFVHGDRRLPMLGKLSMDMIVVDLAQAPDLHEGDWVSLPYLLPDAARQTALSQYELLTVLGNRFG
ncbi:alanine racemase [Erythrobacter sp. QSSC1-22B]|uniref:alanine racemase n=1 Tax=Erythrobacter sp. QSSC1-22B TaxID=1860125 RepID=UPI0008050BE9|nr:alanine racemase [Erythrobacter sp. QSSC1-22B]OBX20238.1 alanine racemase [Erythrobacter sp. QSSC1-22B]